MWRRRRWAVPGADDRAEALQQISEALAQRGFRRDWSRPSLLLWRGEFAISRKSYPISVNVVDLDFVRLPEITIDDLTVLPLTPLTHLFEGDGICYLDRTSAVLDRYDPAGTVLRCLDRAQRVLSASVSGASDQDFAEEFGAYWKETVYVDLPPDFRPKRAQLYWLSLREEKPELGIGVIAQRDQLAEALLIRHRKISGRKTPESQPCAVARVEAHLTVHPGDWPLSNLAVYVRWLAHFVPNAEEMVWDALALDGERKVLALRAANGCFVAEFEIPPMFRKPEFKSRKGSLPQILMAAAENVPVRRMSGYRIDGEYVYGRNMHGIKNLSAKKVAIVGCGTIGGFLAHALAQSGAGTGKGELHLFDIDALKPSNLGRHVLGVPQLGKPKAEGMRSFLDEQLPHIDIRAHIGSALDHKEMLLGCDLVIDATGEEALSLALNHHFVASRPKSPPILFVWLVGNGAAAEAIMCIESGLACLKCLKPELAGNPRFRVLREEAVVERDLACGDATYIPFPVSRSMQAAALAADMAIDWANGRPRPYFRTRTFDERRAFHVKDQSPQPSPRCPACQAG